MEGLTGPTAARRKFAAALTPPLRVPAEAVVGRRFYFGTPWGEFRKAPGYLPDFLTTRVTGPQGPRREVPGWVNELLDATPLSRLEGMADMIAGVGTPGATRPTGSEVALTALSGVRAQRVNERRAVQDLVIRALERARERGEVGEIRRFYPRGDEEPTGRTARALEVQRALDRSRERRRRR